jgi:hypothetical protein
MLHNKYVYIEKILLIPFLNYCRIVDFLNYTYYYDLFY